MPNRIVLSGNANFDIEIHGGDGDDVIDLSGLTLNSDHVAYIWGDAGSDTILGAIGKNVIFGDSTMPRNKDEKKYVVNVDPGASGGDYIYGNIGDDIIFGGAGDDKIYGNGGNDILVGDGGEYDVTNNAVSRTAMSDFGGADIIVGGEGDDKIYGGSGDDKIDGSAGDDKIFGETGNDWILGGSDNDKIEGGAGMDIIFGDRFSGSSFDLSSPFGDLGGYSQEFIDAHSENNTIKLVQTSDFMFSLPDGKGVTVPEFATDSLTTYGTDEINGGDGNDLIFGDGGGSAGGNDIIHGGIGNDVIDGDGGNDTICGGIDNDIIYGGDGDDIIDGGAGDDKLYGDAGVTAITLGTTKFTSDETNLDFASNLGLNKNIYIDSISSSTEKGDDRIITGPGMDYVDGQAGNDKVTVNLMGDSSVNYANVVDTGADTDVNTLVVEGTENDDNLLVRRSKDENSLGFVALLPTGGVNQNSSNTNTNIERVNFTEAISVVNLNANGGDDLVSLDGSAKSMNIDGGAGKDTFQIGQLYKSERETTNSAQVLANDAYNTVKTNEEEYLSEGITKDTVVNIEGGSDVDTFIVNHNEGRLSLKGGKGDDNFAVFSYQDENDKPITNGPMSVDGGKGNDSLLVRGTNGDDQFVVSKEGMLSSVVSIKVAGVETTTYDAAAGDDLFNVVSSNAGESQTINGGKGNDTVSVGGIDKAMVLRNADTDGQHCTIKNSIVTEGYDDRDTNFDDVSSAVAEFAIMDTTNSPVVYLKDGVTGRVIEQIDAQEGTPKVVKVCYAGNAKIGSITVSIAAPQLSNMGLMSGDRGIMVSTDGITWKDTATLVLDSSTKEASLYVKAFGDKLAEEPSIQSLSLTSTWTNLEFSGLIPKMKKMELQKSTTVLSVYVSDAATSTAISKAMTFAEEVTIVSGAMNLNEVFTKSKSKASFEFDVYIKGVDGYLVSGTDYRIADDSITFLGSTNVGKEAVIIYRSNSMYVASSKCYIADEEATVTSVIYNDVVVPEKSVASGDIYYVQNGNTIVFYNGSNNRLMTVHGEITVMATMPTYGTPVNTGVAPTPSQDTGAAAYKILVEQNETRIAEGTDSDAYSNTTYVVKLSAAPTVNSAVYVRISPTKLIDKISSTTPEHQLEISCADTASVVSTEADGSLIVKFTQANWQSGLTINVHAKADGFDEDYGIVNVDKSEKLIDEVDGALYAFGEGTTAENVDADTQMLSYQHHLTVGEELKEASVYNEKNEYDSNLLVSVDSLMEASLSITMPAGATVSAYEGKTVRFVSTNANGVACGTDDNGKTIYKNQSDWFRIDKCEIKGDKLVFTLNSAVDYFTKDNSSLLFSGNKDYLFVNEAESVDRIFVNNQAASRDANSTFEAFATKLAEMNFDPTKTYTSEEVAQIAAELGLVGMDAENVLSFFKNVSETEGSMNKDPNALRFTHTEIGKRGISVSDFEFGEYNLGSGSDTVNVNKTIYREDGFQTFTVVNTGSGATGGDSTDDTVNVNSYAEETATVIASGTSAILSELADNGGVTYNYALTGSAEALVEAMGALDESEKIYVDAMLSDGTTQRREVKALYASYFTVVRAFTLASSVTVDTVSFKHGYSGDGQLVVNAQGGDDKINATSNNVTRNDMVVFGGLGDDTINMNCGGIAFGDRGQVLYGEDAKHPVTVLGSTDSGLDYTTGISKNHGDDTESNGPVHRLQTDGVRRGAYEIRSMNDDEGGVDIINVGGTDSVVIGGAAGDTITVSGSNNIALGDNGSVKYYNATNMGAVYGDSLNLGLHTVETTSDSVGDVDTVTISGDKNVAMGGFAGDSIRITGSDNVAIGDGGRYTVTPERLYAESKNEWEGGQDYISTGDGKNAIIGGTDKDTIRTGAGNDAIVGDGGKVIMDIERNALMVTNEGFNVGEDLGTAGADDIDAGDGDNVIFGGLGNDDIRTGRGKDVVFGDNGFATFRGNASEALSQVHDTLAVPEIRNEATLSFNFVGNSQTGVPSDSETEAFGADGFAAKNWNNIGGPLSGTYGNDDREIVRFDDGTRASAVSVSYGGIERHRTTGTDNRINLQGYSHNFANSSTDANAALMNSGLMTTAPNSQNENKLEVSVDGLAQYFTHYSVIVYLDLPDSHSADTSSIRKVSLFLEGSTESVASYFVNDSANSNFNGTYRRSEYTSIDNMLADLAHNAAVLSDELTGEDAVLIDTTSNYVVFEIPSGYSSDRFRVVIEEAFPGQSPNGKNLPGIAAIQVNGSLHAQDVAASSDITHGGDDTISTGGGDDIVVGGTGGDKITTYGDERYGIYDNDVVFGDNAKMVFTDRDNSGATASMLSMAESLDSRDIEGNYADRIITGNGNDVVVGGLGADYIDSGATADADSMLDGIKVVSFNFTRENATAVEMVAPGEYIPVLDDNNHPVYENGEQKFNFIPHETAGVVADNDWTNLYIKNNRLHIVGENENNSDTPVKHDGVGISLVAYDTAVGNGTQNSSLMLKDDAQLDGDTSNSRLFNAYYAAQQQQEIKLTLTGLDTFRTGSELGASAACDVYVYLGGDQQGVDSYNYLFDVCGRQPGGNALDQHYYLNDWTGNHFDGDYRQVTCSVSPTKEDLLSQVAPDMSLIGNYVVFRNVTSATFEVRIRNLFTDTNQWPLNLPVITAVQVVAVADRKDDIAIGGDHDKDLVFGDDARVTFDIDLPFARNENQADYANRAVEAQSIHIDGNAVEIPLDGDGKPVEMGDTILTGRDRDVIVGGDFGDTITMGDGDDVAIGDNASIILEHNNPIGVFAPSVEIMLEQHSVNTSNGEVFLGNDNTQASQIQSKFENGGVPGVSLVASTNGGTDTFTDVTGKDWTLQQEVTPGTISRTIDISSGAQVITFAEGETVLLVSDTWPGKDNPWWNPNIVLISDGQGHSVPALAWEWDVNGSTMTASTQEGYYFTVDIPDTPNGDNRYEIRVTALAAGTAVISIG